MLLKNELQHLISGIGEYAEANLIQTVTDYLRKCKEASGISKTKIIYNKEQEAKDLIKFAHNKGLLLSTLPDSDYLHDENVISNNGVLFFIDTVFYIQSFNAEN